MALKFAVIEYSSKTGKIWRHQNARPNYLADPQHEMDPTSFGCYVSALAGEHIPLLGLILGPVNAVTPWQRLWRKVVKRVTGRWPQSYSLNYLASFDAVLVVHQISDGHEVTAFTQRLKETYPRLSVLGVPTQPFGILKKHWETQAGWLADFKVFMSNCDVFLSLVAATVPAWQALSTAPVVYAPQPYPVEFTRQFFTPPEQKQKIIYVAGVPSREGIRRGFIVARLLQQRFPEYVIHLTAAADEVLPSKELAGARYTILPFAQWREHLAYLQTVMLVINTDATFTRGRVQVDCAAVGTPSIGANSDGQVDLWPQLPVGADTADATLVAQGERLLTDAPFYDEVTRYARGRLPYYAYAAAADRLRELIVHAKKAL